MAEATLGAVGKPQGQGLYDRPQAGAHVLIKVPEDVPCTMELVITGACTDKGAENQEQETARTRAIRANTDHG